MKINASSPISGLVRFLSIVTVVLAVATIASAAAPIQETVLHSFTLPGGTYPTQIAMDSSGNLYGSAEDGGTVNSTCTTGCGVVFELSPNASGTWTETVLYSFSGGPDGRAPAGLVLDSAGNLYGTTMWGGTPNCGGNLKYGCGVVYELSPSSVGVWTETVLHSFTGSDGYEAGALTLDSGGTLYGTAGGGLGNGGTVYELSPQAGGSWNFEVLYSFCVQNSSCPDGWAPNGPLTLDSAGNVYGTTTFGGSEQQRECQSYSGCGVAFELLRGSAGWTEKVLYAFGVLPIYADGDLPTGGMIFDGSGNLYGAAEGGGTRSNPLCITGCGVIFELSPTSSGSWTETVLYSFTGHNDGSTPIGPLTFDGSGNLFGAAISGGNSSCGTHGCGVILELKRNLGWKESVVHTFSGNDGQYPLGGLIFDPARNLYGATYLGGSKGEGVVYEFPR